MSKQKDSISMRVSFDGRELFNAFQVAAAFTDRRGNREVLRGVRLTADADLVVLEATNGEMSCRIPVAECSVQLPGVVILPVDKCLAILKDRAGDAVVVEVRGDSLVITDNASEFKLLTTDPANFPALSRFDDAACRELSVEAFRLLVSRVVGACDETSSRFTLASILFEFGEGSLLAVATDTHVVSQAEVPATATGIIDATDNVLLRGKSVATLARCLTGDTVQIAARPNEVLFRCGSAEFVCLRSDGRFPRWRDAITNPAFVATAAVGPFSTILRRAATTTNGSDSIGVTLSFSEGEIQASAKTQDVGDSRVSMPATCERTHQSTFDPRLLLDLIKNLPAESNIELLQDKPGGPLRINPADEISRHVIMPMARN